MVAVPAAERTAARLRSPLLLPLTIFCVGVGALGALANGNANATDLDVVRLAAWLAWPLVAAVLLDARPGHLLGRLMVLPGLLPVAVLAAASWEEGRLPDVARAASEAPHLLAPALAVLLVGVPLTFPTGRPEDLMGRRIGVAAAAVVLVGLAAASLQAGRPGDAAPPVGLASGARLVQQVCLVLLLPLAAGALLRQVRLRRGSTGIEANRRDWFMAVALLAAVIAWGAPLLPGDAVDVYVRAALVMAVPVALVLLVLRPSVPPLDRLLVRTGLVAAGATVLLGVHGAAVLLLATTDLPDPRAAAFTVTAVAGLALLPAYVAVRDAALVAVFGHGRRPGQAMVALGRSVDAAGEAEQALAAALAAVAAAVRSPGARVLPPGDDASVPDGAVLQRLVVAGHDVGHLVVLPRRAGEVFGRRELELLEVLAIPLAQLLRVQLLTHELELARGDAVAQRLDERRRLRRDLHDSLGPLLAGLGLQADALRRAARPEDAEGLGRVTDAVRASRQEVRRLVDELEPDSLQVEDLELAVRELVDGWSSATVESSLVLRVDVPQPLPPLPVEVRVAAYRVVGEALTNAVQHAHPRTCTVRLEVASEHLLLEVRDDGRGIATAAGGRSGVGLRSMDERTRGLGGALEVLPASSGLGTVVRARLPLAAALPAPAGAAPAVDGFSSSVPRVPT